MAINIIHQLLLNNILCLANDGGSTTSLSSSNIMPW